MMKEQVILRTVSRLMIPFIVLFALYVIFHGEGGPGGGFQGGVIMGAAVALYGMIYGREAARAALNENLFDALCGIGVSVYAGIGFICILLGGNMLQYGIFAGKEAAAEAAHHSAEAARAAAIGTEHVAGHVPHAVQHANHWGVFGVEMGVAITVTAVMIQLFFEISRRDPKDAA